MGKFLLQCGLVNKHLSPKDAVRENMDDNVSLLIKEWLPFHPAGVPPPSVYYDCPAVARSHVLTVCLRLGVMCLQSA